MCYLFFKTWEERKSPLIIDFFASNAFKSKHNLNIYKGCLQRQIGENKAFCYQKKLICLWKDEKIKLYKEISE